MQTRLLPSKRIKKPKKITLAKAKKLLLEDVKRMIRESGECVVTGQGKCGGVLQASHIMSEGAYKNLFVDPQNIFPMCWKHHFFFWHRNIVDAVEWFKKDFPAVYTYLQKNKKTRIDFTIENIQALRAATKQGNAEYINAYQVLKK